LLFRQFELKSRRARNSGPGRQGPLPKKDAAIFVEKLCPDRYPQEILEASTKATPKVIIEVSVKDFPKKIVKDTLQVIIKVIIEVSAEVILKVSF
jgi:hypothetical protein